MFTWHLQKLIREVVALSSDRYFPPHWVKSQQPTRRLAFEIISQSDTKSAQSRKPRRERETERKRKFLLTPIGVLTLLGHPSTWPEIFQCTCLQKFTFKHLPQSLRSHIRKENFWKYPPFPKIVGVGGVTIFFFLIWIQIFLWLRSPCKILET